MEMFVLVIISLVGMGAISALSIALYRMLPASMLEGARRHGRFAGLGTPERQSDNTASAARSTGSNTLQGQSV